MTYEEMLDAIRNGADWYISFDKKTLLIDGKTIIDGGIRFKATQFDVTQEALDSAFALYKHSIPNKNEPSRPYFKALKYDKLSEEDKTFGESRDLARFRLEYLVLEAIMQGVITLEDSQWYWQSKKHKDFIILRSWIKKEQNQ